MSDTTGFETHHKKDGQPKTCKFCHKHVWWSIIERRWFEPGGKELHSPNCDKSREHYKAEAADRQQSMRMAR